MSDDTSPPDQPADKSLRNFVLGLLAVSAVVIVAMYLIQSSAA